MGRKQVIHLILALSSGHVPQKKMIQAGLVLNITFALVISTIAWWLMD